MRQRCEDLDALLTERVRQRHAFGVQMIPRITGQPRSDRLWDPANVIDWIADKRVPDAGQMNAYLMRASRAEVDLENRILRISI